VLFYLHVMRSNIVFYIRTFALLCCLFSLLACSNTAVFTGIDVLSQDEFAPLIPDDIEAGPGRTDEDGDYHEGVLNGVSVTPLSPMHMSQERTYLEKMYSIKKIR
jgi:hypothetical protein